MLSVVVREVQPNLRDDEIQKELRTIITKCIMTKTKPEEPNYMVRILTTHSQTITDLLSDGFFIYRRRYRVKPYRS